VPGRRRAASGRRPGVQRERPEAIRGAGWIACFGADARNRRCTGYGRCFAGRPSRQPGEHVHPRGSDDLDRRADDGGVREPRPLRPACAAKHPAVDRPGPRRELVVELGRHATDLPAARWCPLHDGKPFTADDVRCTWDMLLGKAAAKFRINPRKPWYWNLDRVTTNGDYEATFHLRQPQPALIALLASGYSPVYPCHVPLQEMRQHPIGTGP